MNIRPVYNEHGTPGKNAQSILEMEERGGGKRGWGRENRESEDMWTAVSLARAARCSVVAVRAVDAVRAYRAGGLASELLYGHRRSTTTTTAVCPHIWCVRKVCTLPGRRVRLFALDLLAAQDHLTVFVQQ
eukprot:2157459-Pleurochrysis_carterae.AAC.1